MSPWKMIHADMIHDWGWAVTFFPCKDLRTRLQCSKIGEKNNGHVLVFNGVVKDRHTVVLDEEIPAGVTKVRVVVKPIAAPVPSVHSERCSMKFTLDKRRAGTSRRQQTR